MSVLHRTALRVPRLAARFGWGLVTAGSRPLPDVLILGAQRAGTTSLFNYLVRHPGVGAPIRKEIHYFDLNYHRGERWYRAHLPSRRDRARSRNRGGGSVSVDASPYYLFHPAVPPRAAAVVPEARLLAVLRNPVDRALSHYHHEVRLGRETLSFEAAVEAEPARIAGEAERLRSGEITYSPAHHRHSYLARGEYAPQLRAWLEHFPPDRLHVVLSEDLFRDPAGTMAGVHRFLGLPEHREAEYGTFGVRGSYQGMEPGTRARLLEHFAPHNRELYALIGREAEWAR